MTRTTLLSGPAAATFNGHTYFAQDGIVISPALELDGLESDTHGWLDDSVVEQPVTIRFTPSAPFADLSALYPWLEGRPGTSLFGADDSPLVLTAANGVRLTFAAAGIIGMPDLHLAASGSVAGAVTFLALGSRTAPREMVSADVAEIPLAPRRTPQLTGNVTITWSRAPWLKLRALDGVRLRFVMTTRPVHSDAHGQVDLTLDRLQVEARFTPAVGGSADGSLSEMDAMNGLGLNQRVGRSGLLIGNALEIAGDSLYVRLPVAQLIGGELAFDATHPRLGELIFAAERAWLSNGLPADLVTLTA